MTEYHMIEPSGVPVTTNSTSAKVKQIGEFTWAVGRRKCAVARVRVKLGRGRFFINGDSDLLSYFKRETLCQRIRSVFIATSTVGQYDVYVNVKGGGLSGQAGAVLLGISRALSSLSLDMKLELRKIGYLTRDPRAVERKKYGKRKARRSPQFSKR